MTRTPKSSTERQARKIGTALAKGRLPAQTRELDALIRDGEAVFDTLEELVAHLQAGDADGPLAQGYHHLLCGQLESLRFQRDRGYDLATGILENVQRAIATHVSAERLAGEGLSLVLTALHQAAVPPSVELQAAIEKSIATEAMAEPASISEVAALLSMVVDTCEGDAFRLVDMLAEAGHALPVEPRAKMAAVMSVSDDPTAREAGTLMLLDPHPTIRRAVIVALESDAASISPLSMRRLIATRNWHPPDERGRIDGIVRAARARGIECASWPDGRVDTIMSSGIDGSGAQTSLIVSPTGRRKCLSSILFKHGLRDAWTGEPQTERELAKMFSELGPDVTMTAVSRTYLDRIVCHGIQLRLDRGECPPASLLQLAEILGAANWQPERLDLRGILATLLAEVPPARLQPPAVAATLRDSNTWAALPGLAELLV